MAGATIVFLLVGASGAAVLLLGLLGSGLLGLIGFGGVGGASAETVAAFVGTFGFAAAIAGELFGARTPGGVAVAGAVGLAAAVPVAYLAVRLSRWARDIPTDATPGRADLVGAIGVVVTPIPDRGYGEVRVRVAGQPVKLHARADRPVPYGAEVFVVEAPSHASVVVEPLTPSAGSKD
jgi:membrane protein implicated in regulation of membrane protease activity